MGEVSGRLAMTAIELFDPEIGWKRAQKMLVLTLLVRYTLKTSEKQTAPKEA